jgi:predicted porin
LQHFTSTLVPLALSTLVSAAFAQTAAPAPAAPPAAEPIAVTSSIPLKISGRVDIGLKSAIPSDLSTGTNSSESVDEGSNARLNFSGSSNINADLSSFFMLEMRFSADTGATGSTDPLFKDGEVKLGRLHSPQYGVSTAGRYEAFVGDSYASNGTRGALASNQWNNAVYYTTPSAKGVNAGLIFSKGEKTAANGIGAHLAYTDGPASAAISVQQEQDKWDTTTQKTMDTLAMGAYYDFGIVRIGGTYARSSKANITSSGSQAVTTLGARVPYGPGEFRVSYRMIDETAKTSAADASKDVDSNRLGLGYAWLLDATTGVHFSLVRDTQIRFNANGSERRSDTGEGMEISLRKTF